jgi:hypothetical protein
VRVQMLLGSCGIASMVFSFAELEGDVVVVVLNGREFGMFLRFTVYANDAPICIREVVAG